MNLDNVSLHHDRWFVSSCTEKSDFCIQKIRILEFNKHNQNNKCSFVKPSQKAGQTFPPAVILTHLHIVEITADNANWLTLKPFIVSFLYYRTWKAKQTATTTTTKKLYIFLTPLQWGSFCIQSDFQQRNNPCEI